MILKGSQRTGGVALARHLMNVADNEHVSVHELRGFVSGDLESAFTEAYAISRGTQTKQFLFSLSLSPPETEVVPIEVFEKAVSDIEEKLGLTGQPRALVFHEKMAVVTHIVSGRALMRTGCAASTFRFTKRN